MPVQPFISSILYKYIWTLLNISNCISSSAAANLPTGTAFLPTAAAFLPTAAAALPTAAAVYRQHK